MASMWMAKESGGFAKEGLDVEMISMSSVLALPALIANEVDAIQISAVPLINASLRGFDVVFIAGMLNTMIWDLYARPEIKSAEQLKAKIVGTERPGSPVAYGTLVALRKASVKFDAAKDFNKMKAKLLYVLCTTDKLFPPSIAPAVMEKLKAAGVDAAFFELKSELGHSASGAGAPMAACCRPLGANPHPPGGSRDQAA